jgi:hypothetical protein
MAEPMERAILIGVVRGTARALGENFVAENTIEQLQNAGRQVTIQLVDQWDDGELPPGMQALGAELLTLAIAARAERVGMDEAVDTMLRVGGSIWRWIKDFIDGPRWDPNA